MRRRDMNRDWIAAARTLNEALPYLQRYDGATVVIKFGGNAMGDADAMASFARDIVLMRQVGVNPVIVHGGGPMIGAMLDRLGIKTEFIRGKRVTDQATAEVVEMVLSGLVNKRIVQAINAEGGQALGLSGKDANLMICDPAELDLGLVGDPAEVGPGILRTLL
ncbi:MAG: acetylglutamate kinase, partial [Boseongicola sp. SB0670_bin_30]|nr:acetylglutamate kinase [Boseongicola sp. SB0670_bin_30]